LVALLHEGFGDSPWTDQEVGFCLGRLIPVFSIRLGCDPYGLFGRRQAFAGHNKSAEHVARELFDRYRSHPQTASKIKTGLVHLFCASNSFADAKLRCGWLEQIDEWDETYNPLLETALRKNSQIYNAHGVPERVRGLIAKHTSDPQAENDYDLDSDIPF
jgi:hypothetical protein